MAYMFEFPHTRTYDNDLGWLIKNVKTVAEAVEALDAWKESAEGSIQDLQIAGTILFLKPPAMITKQNSCRSTDILYSRQNTIHILYKEVLLWL